MTAATRLALNLGAPLAVVLGTIGHVLTAEAEAAAERDAMLAGPQTTARVLLALPVLGMGIGWLLGVNPLKNTFGGGLGTVSVALGVGFMVAGRCWITRMIASAKASGEVT
jgi:tight adherence protein B